MHCKQHRKYFNGQYEAKKDVSSQNKQYKSIIQVEALTTEWLLTSDNVVQEFNIGHRKKKEAGKKERQEKNTVKNRTDPFNAAIF